MLVLFLSPAEPLPTLEQIAMEESQARQYLSELAKLKQEISAQPQPQPTPTPQPNPIMRGVPQQQPAAAQWQQNQQQWQQPTGQQAWNTNAQVREETRTE